MDVATAACYLNWFTGSINRTASSFNNVSFWNREDGVNARGGTWQSTTGTIYNNTVVGPFGTQLNLNRFGASINSRMFARFANQGDTTLTQANHAGLATNYDFRSLGQITAATTTGAANLAWFMDIDTSGHIYFINWLPGRPDVSANFGFTNIFNSPISIGGQAHACVGTNATLGTGDHILTFAEADADQTTGRGIFIQSGAWDVDTPPTYIPNTVAGRALTTFTDATDAIIFRDQHYDRSTESTSSGNGVPTSSHVARLQTINDLTQKSYRKYSWTQQPLSLIHI